MAPALAEGRGPLRRAAAQRRRRSGAGAGDAVLRWQGGEAARSAAAARDGVARALAACGLLPPGGTATDTAQT
ncbi:hypothetical protein ACFFMP_02615 [Pseudoroseomonas cervicalis]